VSGQDLLWLLSGLLFPSSRFFEFGQGRSLVFVQSCLIASFFFFSFSFSFSFLLP